ncbi:O-antigen ligase family protein [Aliarcobacter faecis]|nr:O-antigen ligase family protein [Aliarcobacter faecis]
MIINIKNIEYSKISSFADKLLILFILCFSFFVSFHPVVGKYLVNNMFYIWLISLNFKNIFFYLKNNKIFLFIIIFFLWITFTVIIIPTTNYYNYDNFIKYFLLPILIIITTIKKEHIKYIISAFLAGMFINELISYGIYFELIQNSFLGFNIVGNKFNPVPFLTSHIEYTLFLSFTIIVSLFSIFTINSKFLKVLLSLFITTMTINLFITTGRTGQFTLLMTIIFLIIIYFRHNIKYIMLSFVTIFSVFILAFNFSSNTNTRLQQGYSDIIKLIENKDYNTSFGIRLTSYIIIPDIIKDERFNLFYGMGYCEKDRIIQDIQIKKIGTFMEGTFGHLHNTYIALLAGTGFVGIIIFLILWYYLFTLKIEDGYINYIRYSFFFVISFGGISSELFWQKEVMLLSAIFISIIIYTTTNNKKEKINE